MAACGSLQHIFENPLSADNPKSQSTWNQIKPREQSSFTEIFGELHFKENSNSSSSSSSSCPFHMSSFIDFNSQTGVKQLNKSTIFDKNCEENSKTPSLESFSSTQKTQYSHQKSEIFSSMNHESLQLCTEGLGFESSDDVEDMINGRWEQKEERAMRTTEQSKTENLSGELKRSRTSKAVFPPPISCIGESGKPWVCFKSYREDGRFVLKEIRIPTTEFLHACREDGRLKLQFVQPNSEITEEEEEEEEEDDEENFDDEGNGVEEDDLKGDFQEEN